MKALFVSLIFFFSSYSHGKKYSYKEANLQFSISKDWKEKQEPRFDAYFTKNNLGGMFGLKRMPPTVFAAKKDLPSSLSEYKTYLKDNLLKSQINRVSMFINDSAEFKPFNSQGFEGFLYKSLIEEQNQKFIFYNWLFWADKGAYNAVYVSRVFGDESFEFMKIAGSIKVIDPDKNPFVFKNRFDVIDRTAHVNEVFGYTLPTFRNWLYVDSSDYETSDDENILGSALANYETGDAVFVSPLCLSVNTEERKMILKSFTEDFTESPGKLTLTEIDGKEVILATSDKFGEDLENYYYSGISYPNGDCILNVLVLSGDKSESVNLAKSFVEHIGQADVASAQNHIYSGADQRKAFSSYYVGLGEMAVSQGMDGLKFYRKAYDVLDNLDNATFLLNALNSDRKYREGLNTVQQLNKELLETMEIISWHAWFLAKTEDTDAAIKEYEKLFQKGFHNDEDLFTYLSLLENTLAWQSALKLIDTHFASVSKQVSVSVKKALYLARLENKQQSLQVLDELKSRDQVNMDNIFDVMDVYYYLAEHQIVEATAKEYLQKHSQNGSLWYYLGEAQFNQNQFQQALDSMEKAREYLPGNESVKNYIEAIKHRLGSGNYIDIAAPLKPVEMPSRLLSQIKDIKAKNTGQSDSERMFLIQGIEFKEGEQLTETIFSRRKIFTQNGVDAFKTLQFEYDEDYENIFINSLKVYDSEGTLLEEFDPSTVYITDGEDSIKADSDKMLNIPVPAIEVGVEIEWKISTRTISPLSELPFERNFYISYEPRQLKSVFVRGDVDKVKSASVGNFEVTKTDELIIWNHNESVVYHSEPYMPNVFELSDWLILYSDQGEWIELGDEYLEKINSKIHTRIPNGQLMSIFGGVAEEEEKIQNAAGFVQQSINYQALEFGSRALIPNTSLETIKNKYGDCKDHAVLLHDLLKSQNIDSHLMLVDSSYNIQEKIPALDQFDHMIVYVPSERGDFFIDTTNKNFKVTRGEPPQNLYGKKALVLEKNKSKIISMPMPTITNNSLSIERKFDLQQDKVLVSETVTMTGWVASGIRSAIKSRNSSELVSLFQDWISANYSNLLLRDLNHYNLNDIQKPLILDLNFELAAESARHLPFFFEKAYVDLNHLIDRKFDYQVKEPFLLKSRTQLSDGFRLEKFSSQIESKDLQYELSKNDANELLFSFELKVTKGNAGEYKGFVDKSKSIVSELESSISINK